MNPKLLDFYKKELQLVKGELKNNQQKLYRHLQFLDVSEKKKEKSENEQRYISELPLLTISDIRALLRENDTASKSLQITIVEKNDLMRYQRRLAVIFYNKLVNVLKTIVEFLKMPETPHTKTKTTIHQSLKGLSNKVTIHRKQHPELSLWDIYKPSTGELMLDHIMSLLTAPISLQQIPRTPPTATSSPKKKQVPSAPVKRKRSDSTQQQL